MVGRNVKGGTESKWMGLRKEEGGWERKGR